MKTLSKATINFGIVLISIVALWGSAKAQTMEHKVTAMIPFNFSVAGKEFAAGKYSIIRVNQNAGDLVLKISSSDDRFTVFRMTIPVQTVETRNEPAMVFHRYGDEYFLAQVWPAGARTGRAFTKSRRERELERQQQVAAKTGSLIVGTVTIFQ